MPSNGYWAPTQTDGSKKLEKCGKGCEQCDPDKGNCTRCKPNLTKNSNYEAKECICPVGFEWNWEGECIPSKEMNKICRHD